MSPSCQELPRAQQNIIGHADTDDGPVPPGAEGRILVRTPGQIETYTDGTRKSDADGFLDTGDRGHLDAAGRLHVADRSTR